MLWKAQCWSFYSWNNEIQLSKLLKAFKFLKIFKILENPWSSENLLIIKLIFFRTFSSHIPSLAYRTGLPATLTSTWQSATSCAALSFCARPAWATRWTTYWPPTSPWCSRTWISSDQLEWNNLKWLLRSLKLIIYCLMPFLLCLCNQNSTRNIFLNSLLSQYQKLCIICKVGHENKLEFFLIQRCEHEFAFLALFVIEIVLHLFVCHRCWINLITGSVIDGIVWIRLWHLLSHFRIWKVQLKLDQNN